MSLISLKSFDMCISKRIFFIVRSIKGCVVTLKQKLVQTCTNINNGIHKNLIGCKYGTETIGLN